jgi:hypothetical protein
MFNPIRQIIGLLRDISAKLDRIIQLLKGTGAKAPVPVSLSVSVK